MSFYLRISNYRFSKNLGNGTFGKVKLAYNEITGHKVAVKILNKCRIKQQGVLEKVKREIKVLRQFNHPHIIKHYELVDTKTDIFMVIEYAAGGELFDLISRKEKLDEQEARKFFQQIISSIDYTHQHRITHRDLKPENLLLDEYGNIKLIDFGLANSMKDTHSLKTACGSPNYAAPELISGKYYGGEAVDVWSIGIILYAMVCGTLPFDDDSMSNLFNKIKEGKYQIPNFVSNDVKDLINRMLQPNPIKRITLKEIQEHPWYLIELPLYLQEIHLYTTPVTQQRAKDKKRDRQIDQDILKKIFQYTDKMNKPQDEVIKSIQEKKNTDFCGVYEILYHEKMKKQIIENQQEIEKNHKQKKFKSFQSFYMHKSGVIKNKNQENIQSTTLTHQNRLQFIYKKIRRGNIKMFNKNKEQDKLRETQINNYTQSTSTFSSLTSALNQQPLMNRRNSLCLFQGGMTKFKDYIGIIFEGQSIQMMYNICEILKDLNIEWQQQTLSDLKLKCRTVVDDKIADDDEVIKEFLRKVFLKFFVHIYKYSSNQGLPQVPQKEDKKTLKDKIEQDTDEHYCLDLCLFKGNPLVFMDFFQIFYECLISKCSDKDSSIKIRYL